MTDSTHDTHNQQFLDRGPNESFEALIDLLASDDILEDIRLSSPQSNPRDLRDSDGRLDFEKIRSFFSTKNRNLSTATSRKITEPVVAQDLNLVASTPLVGPSNPTLEVLEAPLLSRLSDVALSGKPSVSLFPCADLPPTAQPDVHGVLLPKAAESNTHPVNCNLDPAWLTKPLEFTPLNQALLAARAETDDLRAQYEKLQALLSKDPPQAHDMQPPYERIEDTCCSTDIISSPPTEPPFGPEIASLSENDAKRTLAVLFKELSIPSSFLSSYRNVESQLAPAFSEDDVAGNITHAMQFLTRVDEIVWHRSSHAYRPGSCPPSVFSEANVNALLDRIALWERAFRRERRV
ncbi:hypothetical protein SERLADRAFT_438849 [Serpula lacrymans var. lacrymans S7.9]|uniref:Uncharacterized protein n=1 Tax=Serpula lacrymans var. lacrymans (strain S7.9) TaxID=578457 RepID=F8P0I2_SERL9|nr:uncharacterized protein SERLADRAFT_438849 [Serpula lacrymans var. lacrymans S7.9]EGO23537.1 hypothetical protein SERLADRAFT_438849 [Serpula lacrymans var. lacrymans S7.9]